MLLEMIRRLEPTHFPRAAAGLAALIVYSGCATPPSTTYRETYQASQTGDNRTSSLTELLEVGLQDNVGPDLQYRVSERLIHTDLSLSNGDLRRDEDRLLHQPSLDLILTAGTLRWIQGFESQYNRTDPSDSDTNAFRRTDILEKFVWSPVELPTFTYWIDQRNDRDDLFTNREDTEQVFQVEETRGPFNYLYSLEMEQVRDLQAGIDTDRVEHILRAGYHDQFFEDQLSVSASVYVDSQRTTTTTPGGEAPAIPPGEVVPTAGLSAIDSTPEIGALAGTPALIDGDDTTSTGINIGGFASGGEPNWNIGVAVPPDSPLNLILLYTQDEVADFFLADYSFSVWVSDDNNFWTLASGAPAFTYESTFRRFHLLIPEVSARWVKIVNTASSPAAPAVFVTEIQVFGPVPGAGADQTKSRRSDLTENLTGNVTWRPHETLNLGYNTFVQRATQENDDEETRDERRLDNGLTVLWNPTPLLDVSLQGSDQRLRDPVRLDEDFWSLNSLLNLHPLDTLDVAFSYAKTDRETDNKRNFRTAAHQGRAAATQLETLESDNQNE
ncbi:MAG: hypothetical protein AB1486_27355, partial [Planctomycetota bacterium]